MKNLYFKLYSILTKPDTKSVQIRVGWNNRINSGWPMKPNKFAWPVSGDLDYLPETPNIHTRLIRSPIQSVLPDLPEMHKDLSSELRNQDPCDRFFLVYKRGISAGEGVYINQKQDWDILRTN